MSLSVGARLGPYEIVAPLGAGGMGEVYRARDTRLRRDVAVKVLPDTFAGDAERLARFEREAQLLASLNHPNIAHDPRPGGGRRSAIPGHGTGPRRDARRAVDGRAARARPGPEHLPADRRSARGRTRARRDSPRPEAGNVKLTPEGKVKVLDFGLAKALGAESSAPDRTQSPTVAPAATSAGIILGTAAYTFFASKPRMLFEARYERGGPGISNYDVTPDGQRLVMVQAREGESAGTQLNVVRNWLTELETERPSRRP